VCVGGRQDVPARATTGASTAREWVDSPQKARLYGDRPPLIAAAGAARQKAQVPIWEREERERQQFLCQVQPIPGLAPPRPSPSPLRPLAPVSIRSSIARIAPCTQHFPHALAQSFRPIILSTIWVLPCLPYAREMTHTYGQAQASSGSKKLPSAAKASGVDGQRRAAGVSAAAAAAGHVSEEDVDDIYDIGQCGVLFDITSSNPGMPAAGILRVLQVPKGIQKTR
jgi:hypothetical protein